MADFGELSPNQAGRRRVLYENDRCSVGSRLAKRERGCVEAPLYHIIRGKKSARQGVNHKPLRDLDKADIIRGSDLYISIYLWYTPEYYDSYSNRLLCLQLILETVFIGIIRAIDFGDCLLIEIVQTMDFGDHLLIGVVYTIDVGCCL